MDAYENLCTRRSIRNYNDQEVSDEVLEKIVYAGQCAPTGRNRQNTGFVVIKNKEMIDKLSKMNAEILHTDSDPFFGAKAVIIVLVDTKEGSTYEYDGALVMGNLMNAAHALGVSSCWIHRAREMFDSKEGRELLNQWGFSETYAGIGNCILGYSEQEVSMCKRTSKVVWVK